MKDRKILLEVADGPEHICIYTSEDEGIVDWSPTFPAVYLTASINGAGVKLGPFTLSRIFEQLKSSLVKGE